MSGVDDAVGGVEGSSVESLGRMRRAEVSQTEQKYIGSAFASPKAAIHSNIQYVGGC